jgi:hypothetical protein
MRNSNHLPSPLVLRQADLLAKMARKKLTDKPAPNFALADERLRRTAFNLFQHGWSISDIANVVKTTPETIQKWVNSFYP